MTPSDQHATRAFQIWRRIDIARRYAIKLGVLPYAELREAIDEGFDVNQLTIELIYFSIESERRKGIRKTYISRDHGIDERGSSPT